jgi:hypothetical protein
MIDMSQTCLALNTLVDRHVKYSENHRHPFLLPLEYSVQAVCQAYISSSEYKEKVKLKIIFLWKKYFGYT